MNIVHRASREINLKAQFYVSGFCFQSGGSYYFCFSHPWPEMIMDFSRYRPSTYDLICAHPAAIPTLSLYRLIAS